MNLPYTVLLFVSGKWTLLYKIQIIWIVLNNFVKSWLDFVHLIFRLYSDITYIIIANINANVRHPFEY